MAIDCQAPAMAMASQGNVQKPSASAIDVTSQMEPEAGRPNAGAEVLLAKPTPSRPSLTVPPRIPSEALQNSSEITPSPKGQDPDLSFSQLLAGAIVAPTPRAAEGTAVAGSSSNEFQSNPPSAGSFADRLAAKGLGQKVSGGSGNPGAERSNTARFKSMTPSRLPIPRSPYLTIPPGLSPTTLLDSPVLLSTGQAEPSPTTGTFPLPPISQVSGSSAAPVSDPSIDKNPDQDGSPTFVFKPLPKIARNPLPPFTNSGQWGLSHQQGNTQLQAQAHTQASFTSSASDAVHVAVPMQTGPLASSVDAPKFVTPLQSRGPSETIWQSSGASKKPQPLVPQPVPPSLVERPSEDGYNWRKYGQKQVKGSECPRSYYKCTHPNCPVKKKVERSHDGQVTEIVYKGEHDHPKPQATRRMSMAALHGSGRDGLYSSMAAEKADSASIKNDLLSSDPSSSRGQMVDSSGGAEPSFGSISDDDGDGERSKAEDGGDDESDSKRRKRERAGDSATIPPLRTIREPRVVVQTTSDVDILDDGYRWRKYGQKVVKGNPHPRSYYKCTNLGCSVRKHVERSSTDPKAVVTTYEGKHNHDVPAARNSNHDNGGSAGALVSLPDAQTDVSVSSGNTITRPPPSLQDQYLTGKILESRLKGSMDLPGGNMLSAMSADPQGRGQGITEAFVPAPISVMNSRISGGPMLQAESFEQALALRPKEEQSEGSVNPRSLQPTFSNSFLAHDMAQKLGHVP